MDVLARFAVVLMMMFICDYYYLWVYLNEVGGLVLFVWQLQIQL